MVICIQVQQITIYEMVKDVCIIMMVVYMQVNGKMIYFKELVFLLIIIKIVIKVNLYQDLKMVLEYINNKQVINIKEIGEIICDQVMVGIFIIKIRNYIKEALYKE